jgi:acyl-coenzyme A thioesterase PaaI-like protein
MFTLADALMYATILSKVGPKALAVTTNCSIDFLRRPAAGKDLLARCQILKLGKVLVVGDVLMYSATTDDDVIPEGRRLEEYIEVDKPVSRATMTYSVPK